MERLRFKTTPDTWVISLTAAIAAVMLAIAFFVVSTLFATPHYAFYAAAFAGLLMPIILGHAWATSPKGYWLDHDSLGIDRPAGAITIPLRSIRHVRLLDGWVGIARKVWPGGNSGLFGIAGHFTSKELGRFRMYGRRASGAVVIGTDDGTIVLTPDPEGRNLLVQAIEDRIALRGSPPLEGDTE